MHIKGTSGTSLTYRDEFNAMISDCRSGKIDMIITKSVSRFARNVVDCISVVRILAELPSPVGVFFGSECIFSLKDDSQIALSFQATMAQKESHIRSRSMETSLRMRLDGGLPLTPKLLGYPETTAMDYTLFEAMQQAHFLTSPCRFVNILYSELRNQDPRNHQNILTQENSQRKPGNIVCATFPGFPMSDIDQFPVDDFFCLVANIVHASSPPQLVFSFELFGNAFLLRHLLDQLKKHGICLSIGFSRVTVQLADQ